MRAGILDRQQVAQACTQHLLEPCLSLVPLRRLMDWLRFFQALRRENFVSNSLRCRFLNACVLPTGHQLSF